MLLMFDGKRRMEEVLHSTSSRDFNLVLLVIRTSATTLDQLKGSSFTLIITFHILMVITCDTL